MQGSQTTCVQPGLYMKRHKHREVLFDSNCAYVVLVCWTVTISWLAANVNQLMQSCWLSHPNYTSSLVKEDRQSWVYIYPQDSRIRPSAYHVAEVKKVRSKRLMKAWFGVPLQKSQELQEWGGKKGCGNGLLLLWKKRTKQHIHTPWDKLHFLIQPFPH